MGRDLFTEQEKRIASRLKKSEGCSIFDRLELLHSACTYAGAERLLPDQLRQFHGVDLDAIASDLPRIEENVSELVISALIQLETEIAESDLFMLRDVVLQDQFRVRFIDQLDIFQIARYIRMMKPVVKRHRKR